MRKSHFAMLFLALACTATIPFTVYGVNPGTYVYFAWPLNHNRSFDTDIQINDAPESGNAGVYWAHQFWFENGTAGYMGLQVGSPWGKIALFSIWDAVSATPAAGTECVYIYEFGWVWSCHLPFSWKIGSKYRLEVAEVGEDSNTYSWRGSVLDYETNTEMTIAVIQTPKSMGWLGQNSVVWTEYFGQDWNCEPPHSYAVFANPYAQNAMGNHGPTSAMVAYGSNCGRNSNVVNLGGASFALEVGSGVARTIPDGTYLWTKEQAEVNLTPVVGWPGTTVSLEGTGFTASDTSCAISSSPSGLISNPTCAISGGVVSGSFKVANVATGTYTITVTGAPFNDAAGSPFTVESPPTQTLITGVDSGSGSVSPNCPSPSGCSEAVGSSVVVTATPSSGWQFSSWSTQTGISCSSNPCTFSMPNNDVTLKTTFTPPSTTISLLLNPSSISLGSPVTLSGSIVQNPGTVQMTISFSQDSGSTWTTLMILMTDSSGSYSTSWTPPYPGSYLLKANWSGNNQLAGSTSSPASLTVTGTATPSATLLLSAPSTGSHGQSVRLLIIVFNPASSALNANVAIEITGPGNYIAFDVAQLKVAAAAQSTAYYDWTAPNQVGTYTLMVGLLPPKAAAFDAARIQVT